MASTRKMTSWTTFEAEATAAQGIRFVCSFGVLSGSARSDGAYLVRRARFATATSVRSATLGCNILVLPCACGQVAYRRKLVVEG